MIFKENKKEITPLLSVSLFLVVIAGLISSRFFIRGMDTNFLRIIIPQFGLILTPFIIFIFVFRIDIFSELSIFKPPWYMVPITILGAVYLMIISGIINYAFLQLTGQVEYYREFLELLRKILGNYGFWEGLLLIAVTPAICEELVFRGFVLRGLRRASLEVFFDKSKLFSDIIAVLVTAMLFALFHLDFSRILGTFLLGIFLGIISLRGGLLMSMLAHFMINGMSFVILYFLPL